SQIEPGTSTLPGQATALLSATNVLPMLVVNNPTQVVGFVQPSLTAEIRTADNSAPLTAPPVFRQCTPAAPTRLATLSFAEAFSTAFKPRTFSPVMSGVITQNVFGLVYSAESGHYDPNLSTPLNVAGLADFGTRMKATILNIPA